MGFDNSQDAETAIIALEKDLQASVQAEGVVESEINRLNRERLEIGLKLADLKEPLRKARENVKRIESQLRVARSEFFSLKHQGL